MAEEVKLENSVSERIPSWIEVKLFEKLFKETLKDFKEIKRFGVHSTKKAGENYSTSMLRVETELELQDGTRLERNFRLKTAHDSEFMHNVAKRVDGSDVESHMYDKIIPEFERMYFKCGVEVHFGPKSYKLDTNRNYLLLEDLTMSNFKNASRVEGLDMNHTKCVLKKLAQWHAVSAVRHETVYRYEDILYNSFYTDAGRPMLQMFFDGMIKSLTKSLKHYNGHESYYAQVERLEDHAMDELFKAAEVNFDEFNVLNHADVWVDNIMFQYDDEDKITETYLIDYQLPKYGSPAQDLLYFILSSCSYELKLSTFDYFIKFYHDHLVEHLQLLKYPKRIPSLRDIHIMLYKYGIWGFCTAVGVMATALLEQTDNANWENLVGDTEEAVNFKLLMLSHDRYRKHMEAILPWLLNRGALEC